MKSATSMISILDMSIKLDLEFQSLIQWAHNQYLNRVKWLPLALDTQGVIRRAVSIAAEIVGLTL